MTKQDHQVKEHVDNYDNNRHDIQRDTCLPKTSFVVDRIPVDALEMHKAEELQKERMIKDLRACKSIDLRSSLWTSGRGGSPRVVP